MPDPSAVIESGRTLIRAAGLDPAKNKTLYFDLGDLLQEVPKEALPSIGAALGITPGRLRAYQQVARQWPAEHRVDAPWTAHRTLASNPKRFELIQPGMGLRAAQAALGKFPSDSQHPSRWSIERKALFIVDELTNKEVDNRVREELERRKVRRAALATRRMVGEDSRAERRASLKRIRDLQASKSPYRHAYDALFRLREEREFVRYVGAAIIDPDGLFPPSFHDGLTGEVRDLATMAIEVLGALAGQGGREAAEALSAVEQHLSTVRERPILGSAGGPVVVVPDAGARPNPFDLGDDEEDDEDVGTGTS